MENQKPKRENVNLLFTEEQVQKKVMEVAEVISDEFAGQEVVLIGVMRGGAVCFLPDLCRAIEKIGKIPLVMVDYICVSLYRGQHEPGNFVKLVMDIRVDVQGKNVILVEDITDSGKTFDWLKEHFSEKNPKTLKMTAIVRRKESPSEPDYPHFLVEPDQWIVGYGMQEKDYFRNLPYIGWVPK